MKKLVNKLNALIAKNETVDKGVKKAGEWLSVKKNLLSAWVTCILLNVLSHPLVSFATGEDGANNANDGWNSVMDFLLTWVPRIGGVLLFFGGVEFAIAYKNEDANSKTNATRLMVSGAMVIAIPYALSGLLKI